MESKKTRQLMSELSKVAFVYGLKGEVHSYLTDSPDLDQLKDLVDDFNPIETKDPNGLLAYEPVPGFKFYIHL